MSQVYTPADIPMLIAVMDPKLVEKSLDRALTAAARKTRTTISKEIRQEWTLKAGTIGRRVKLKSAKSGGVISRVLLYTGRSTNVLDFRHRFKTVQTARGPRTAPFIKLRKRGGFKQFYGWQVSGKNSGKPILVGRVGRKRQPIESYDYKAVPSMVRNREVLDAAEKTANATLNRVFGQQLTFLQQQASEK